MCSVWLGGGRAFWLLSLSLTFVWSLSPLPLLCSSVVPAECRVVEGRGATHCVVARLVLHLALPACGRLCSVFRIAWFPVSVRQHYSLSNLLCFPYRERMYGVGAGWVWRAAVGGHTSPPSFFVPWCFVVFPYLFRFVVCHTMLLPSCLGPHMVLVYLWSVQRAFWLGGGWVGSRGITTYLSPPFPSLFRFGFSIPHVVSC